MIRKRERFLINSFRRFGRESSWKTTSSIRAGLRSLRALVHSRDPSLWEIFVDFYRNQFTDDESVTAKSQSAVGRDSFDLSLSTLEGGDDCYRQIEGRDHMTENRLYKSIGNFLFIKDLTFGRSCFVMCCFTERVGFIHHPPPPSPLEVEEDGRRFPTRSLSFLRSFSRICTSVLQCVMKRLDGRNLQARKEQTILLPPRLAGGYGRRLEPQGWTSKIPRSRFSRVCNLCPNAFRMAFSGPRPSVR